MKRFVWVALAALLLSYGAKAADPAFYAPGILPAQGVEDAKPGNYSKIKSIAIVSSLGQNIQWFKATWVSTRTNVDIRHWNIDPLIEAALKRALSPKFTVVDAQFDRAKIPVGMIGWFANSKGELKKYFATQTAAPVDAYIVIRPYDYGDEAGLGYDASGGDMSMAEAHGEFTARYLMEVVDAKTFEIIGSAQGRMQIRDGTGASFPGVVVSKTVFPKEMPPVQQAEKTRKIWEMLVSMSILETTRALNFGVALPPIGGRSTYPTPKDEEEYPHIKTIVIASGIGDLLEVANPGFFPNILKTDNHLAIEDMQLDEQVEKVAREILARRFTVKDATVDRAALRKARLHDAKDNPIATITGLPVTANVDAYVAFVKTAGNSPYPWHGPGIVTDWRERPTGCGVFVYYQLAMIDPRTLQIRDWMRGQPSPAWPGNVPRRAVDPKTCPAADAKALTADQHDRIAAILHDEIADSIPETILLMGLSDQSISYHSFLKPEN